MIKNIGKIKGGVLILGSLFWEDERNAIQKRNSIKLGGDRRKWRKDFLLLSGNSVKQIDLPIGYGRKSSSRDNTFTMVLTGHYLKNQGKGLIVPYIDRINFSNLRSFKTQIKNLAEVEGIYTNGNKNFVSDWGNGGQSAVAIYINPNSSDEKQNKIRQNWGKVIEDNNGNRINGYTKNSNDFTWLDADCLLNNDYSLSSDLKIQTNLDFLFCTYMEPNYKNPLGEKDYPTPEIIGAAMNTYSTYFFQNNISKIVSAEDDEIFKHIPKKL